MITKDLIKAQAVLAGLTDEQITAIETLSKNDEDAVIGKRFGEVYREFDEKIVNFLGVKRNGDEKTYDYFERAAKEVKAKADELETAKTSVTSITKEKERLEKVISDNKGDEESVKQLKQAKADLESTKQLYSKLQTEVEEMKGNHSKEILTMKKDGYISEALSKISLKSEFSQALLETAVNNAKIKVKGLPSEIVKNADGSESLVFRNEKGETLTNPNNGLNPFTAQDLLTNELKTLGVLDEGRKQNGAGSTAGASGGSVKTLDISGAKTRVEAGKLIHESLTQQGLVKNSQEYQDATDKAWIDNKVADLPME